MIAFNNVSKTYGKNATVLQDIDLQIKKGEFVSLVGKSGAGKSTLIKLLIGEEKPTKGRVMFNSVEVNKLRSSELPRLRRQIGTVFQDFKLLNGKTAYENVAFALEVEGVPQSHIEEIVPQVLDMVGIRDKRDHFPNQLSGGEQQRVAIARAMVHQPPLLIADEPTGNLDETNSEEIIRLITKINELGTTIILATHNRHVVNALERRVVTLSNGRIVRDEEHGKYVIV